MTDPQMSLLEQAILARAADLQAVASEFDMNVALLVEESRRLQEGSERLRQERYRSRSVQRAGEQLDHNQNH